MNSNYEAFLDLVRLGIGVRSPKEVFVDPQIDWNELQDIAVKQGLSAIVLDGIEELPQENKPKKIDLLQWIGEVLQSETVYAIQQKTAVEMAQLFHNNFIRTYVLKGAVIAECYTKPEHRPSADMDCFLLPEKSDFDAWAEGNDLIRINGFEVSEDFYKNSTSYLPGLTVENHKFMTPFRGNKKLKTLEIILQSMIKEDEVKDRFVNSWMYRPPVMVSAVFLIEHAYSHFLHGGLTWRHVLDWMMFSKKHKKGIDWYSLNAMIDEFGFRKFYDSFERLGRFLLGEIEEGDLQKNDKRMLEDVWSDLHHAESYHGAKAKVSFALNTMRSWWKYHYFAEISMIHALWIQVKGFLFIKHPKLD